MNSKAHGDKKRLKRLFIVAGAMLALFLAVTLISYFTRPQVRYTLKKADCSQTAIAARNKAEGAELKACILTINATNLKDTSEFVDWEGIGGEPFAGWHPMIRINAPGGRFCYAGVVELAGMHSLGPRESRDLNLRCSGYPSEKIPKKYDKRSDETPISVVIRNNPDVTLSFEPAR